MTRSLLSVICLALGGCFYVGKETTRDIIQHPSDGWSSRDCLTVVLESMQSNLSDRNCPNIKVIATPYTPWVVMALTRMSQQRHHWSNDEFQHQIDTAMPNMAGLYLDIYSNHLVDPKGNFLRRAEQLDSLMFLVTLRNNAWPCSVPTFNGVPIAHMTAWPCYIPEITDLAERISLQNDWGLSVRPKYVWGRHNEQLTTEETMLVMFALRSSKGHLLAKTKSVTLTLEGFDAPIAISFPVGDLFPHPTNDTAESTVAR